MALLLMAFAAAPAMAQGNGHNNNNGNNNGNDRQNSSLDRHLDRQDASLDRHLINDDNNFVVDDDIDFVDFGAPLFFSHGFGFDNHCPFWGDTVGIVNQGDCV